MSHYLYLVRHGEQQDAEHGLPDGPLSPRGMRQAAGDRRTPRRRAVHRRLDTRRCSARRRPRAIMAERMPALEPEPSRAAHGLHPVRARRPTCRTRSSRSSAASPRTRSRPGEAQMADAVAELLTPVARRPPRPAHHPQLRRSAGSCARCSARRDWRWLGINQANCGLTIIRVRSAKPPVLVTHNDLGHLPAELRTGLPVDQPY